MFIPLVPGFRNWHLFEEMFECVPGLIISLPSLTAAVISLRALHTLPMAHFSPSWAVSPCPSAAAAGPASSCPQPCLARSLNPTGPCWAACTCGPVSQLDLGSAVAMDLSDGLVVVSGLPSSRLVQWDGSWQGSTCWFPASALPRAASYCCSLALSRVSLGVSSSLVLSHVGLGLETDWCSL